MLKTLRRRFVLPLGFFSLLAVFSIAVAVGHAEGPLTLATSGEGSSKTFSVEAPGESVHIYVDGVADQWLTITPSEAGLAGSFSLFDPTGHRVWGAEGDLTEAHGPVLLGETGTYEIVLTGEAGEATGSVRLTAVGHLEDLTGRITPTTEGAEQQVDIASPGQVARYSVPVTTGESVSIVSGDTDLGAGYRLEWLNPAAEGVRTWHPSGERGRFFEPVRFTETGDATLLIVPDEEAAGSVSLVLYDASDGTDSLVTGRAAGTYTVAVPGQRDLIEFDGAEGEQLTITPAEAGFEGEFHLETPTGDPLEGSGGGLGELHGPLTLPETGIYKIDLSGHEAQTGSVKLRAEYPLLVPACSDGSATTVADEALAIGVDTFECQGEGPLEYEVVTSPEHGEVGSYDAEGESFEYTPETGFVGQDSFTVRAANQFGIGNVVTLSIEVEPLADPVSAYSFDEGEGTIAHDVFGDQDGTIEGAEWVEDGRFGSALRFNSDEEQSVEISAGGDLNLTSGLTLEAWVKPEAERTWMPIVVKESATSQAYGLYGAGEIASTPAGLVAAGAEESAEVVSEEALEEGHWSYLTLTSDGDTLRLYIDGSLVGTSPTDAAQLTEGSLRIGGHASWGHYFDGLIDEVRIYNRPLGAEEIAENMGSAVAVTATQTPEIWGRAMVGESLVALDGQWSSRSAVEREVSWMRCDESGGECEAIESESQKWHDVTEEDLGRTFRVRVTAKSDGSDATALSPPTAPVVVADAPEANGPPRLRNSFTNPPAPLVPGAMISVDDRPSGWYPFHTGIYGYPPAAVDLQWQRCDATGNACEDIEDANYQDYYVTAEDVGKTLRVVSSGNNPAGSASTTSEPSEVVKSLVKPVAPASPAAPSGIEPPREKDHLQAPVEIWGKKTGVLSQYSDIGRSFQWQRCDPEGGECAEISSADSQSYLLGTDDVGHTLRVRVTATNEAGEASITTPPSKLVQEYVPESPEEFPFSVDLSYKQPLLGSEITAGYSFWVHHGQGAETVQRQWLRCDLEGEGCQSIAAASGSSYTPTGLDLGHTLRARVKITDEGGTGQVISDASLPVKISPDPELIGSVTLRTLGNGSVLSGSPQVGVDLFAEDDGVWSESALEHAAADRWQWQRCSAEGTACEDIADAWGANGASVYTPRERDVGYRLRVEVFAAGPKGDYAATSEVTAVVSHGAPRNIALPAALGLAYAGEWFSASDGLWTESEPSLTYQWMRCAPEGGSCIKINGAQSREYISVPRDEGKTLRVKITASNEVGESSATSEPTEVLAPPRAPASTSPPTVEGGAVVDEELNGSFGTWEGAEPLVLHGRWLRCDAEGEACIAIPGSSGSEWTLEEEDLGHTLRFQATATNPVESVAVQSLPTEVVTAPPPPVNASPPSFEGQESAGSVLSADPGEWSPSARWFEYQWQLCDVEGEGCEDVEGATDRDFLLPKSAEGMRVRLLVTGHDGGGEETVDSTVGEVVGAMLAPVSTGAPWFSEMAFESRPLEPQLGFWEGGQPMTFSYQWLRCDSDGHECIDIAEATAARYTPTAEDLGVRFRVEITATNDAGTATEISESSGEVNESEPWFAGDLEIEGAPTEGVETSLDISALRGSKPMEVEYQWERCLNGCVAIGGATSQSYTPGAEDIAHRLRVRVKARNSLSNEDLTVTSPYSSPVAPAEAEGAPRIAGYPSVEGWPRETETLTATEGAWRGSGTISTATRWQRCEGEAETCEDIEGATGDAYELGPADVGSRIRAVVTAGNELGEAEAGSRLTPPILPGVDTVISLEAGVSVEALLEAVQEEEIAVVGLEYVESSGAGSGAYSGGVAGTRAQDVLEALSEGHDPDELLVTSITLSGDFTERFGGNTAGGFMVFSFDPIKALIEALVTAWATVPSVRSQSEFNTEEETVGGQPGVSDQEPRERFRGDPGLSLPIIQSAEIGGYERDCPSECENAEVPGKLPPREVGAEFTWAMKPWDLFEEFEDKGYPLAFEFDMKLVNDHNRGSGKIGSPLGDCPPSETEDFWISDRDDMKWESNIPAAAGPYFDTAYSDTCNKKDFTVGVLHPEDLVSGRRYETYLSFYSPGTERSSGFEWHAELLERISGCDNSAWCVNIVPPFGIPLPTGRYRLPQVLIPPGYKWEFPGCYEYHYKEGRRGAQECSIIT